MCHPGVAPDEHLPRGFTLRPDGRQLQRHIAISGILPVDKPDPRWRMNNIPGMNIHVQRREPNRLLELARWIVVSRPGFDLSQLASLDLRPEQQARVHLLGGVHQDVSASELRRRLRAGEACSDWLPEPVLEYIRERGLYGSRA